MLSKIVDNLLRRQNVKLVALSGMGLGNYTAKIRLALKEQKSVVIDIYPHDSAFDEFQKIQAMFLAKAMAESPELEFKRTDQLCSYLQKAQKRLVVILNKIQQFAQTDLYLDFFDSVYRSSTQVTVLITETPGWATLKSCDLLTSCKEYVFPGFIETFDDYVSELEETFGWKVDCKTREWAYGLALGHAGLIKTLVQAVYDNRNFLSEEKLLQNREVGMRLVNLGQSIEGVGKKGLVLSKDEKVFYGLSDGKREGCLWKRYLEKLSGEEKLTSQLTQTEKKIFELLTAKKEEFSTIDEILEFLSPSAFETKTNWSIYKHISNLAKKIEIGGYRLEGKRSVGYRLVEST